MSSSARARRNNNGRRLRRQDQPPPGQTPRLVEQLQISMEGIRPTIHQPALRTFTSKLSQNSTGLQQSSGFVHTEFGFELGNMNGSADYTALFDAYRILKIEAVIRPTYTTGVAASAVTFAAPTVYTVIDYDDSNPLTTASAFREYSNCTITQYESIRRSWVPAIVTPAYVSGGTATGYMNVYSPWIDITSVTVEHYGLKVGMDGGTSTVPQVLEINVDFLVEFRCTR